jgi:membrane dipeptidase
MPDRIPVFDGHNDVLMRGARGEEDFDLLARHDSGHLDLPRMKEGGFAGGFFAVFVPNARKKPRRPPPTEKYLTADGYRFPLAKRISFPHATQLTMRMITRLFQAEARSAGALAVVRDAEAIERALAAGTVSAILHFEGAEMIDRDLTALEFYYQIGLRSLGLVWSRPNIFGEGVPFVFPSTPDIGGGLTDAGKALVRACNQLGILIDLSHLNKNGFWDVAAISAAPLVATHSNVHALCPAGRNLVDKQLDAIRETDGMVGLNFAVTFLRDDGYNNPNTPIETMVRHIDYLVERVGIDRVGFGSDFDGATIPEDIRDVTGLPLLIDALRAAGYDDAALRRIAHQNWLRVLRKTWKTPGIE